MRRFLLIFVAAIIGSALLHELGHAAAGWVQGIPVVPTPFKEYVLRDEIPWREYIWTALGGLGGTVVAVLGTFAWYWQKDRPSGDAVLAGVLLTPCAYSLRYLIVGRGHDGLEWQAAQAALGVTPTGHVVDLGLAALAMLGVALWVARRRLAFRPSWLVKIGGLAVGGIVVLVVCQVGNNALFDGAFPRVRITDVPPDVQASQEQ